MIIKPLANCNVLLLQAKDFSLLKGTICKSDGVFNSQHILRENFYASSSLQISKRMFKISGSKNFGNTILTAKRERNTVSEEGRKRVSQQIIVLL